MLGKSIHSRAAGHAHSTAMQRCLTEESEEEKTTESAPGERDGGVAAAIDENALEFWRTRTGHDSIVYSRDMDVTHGHPPV